MRGEGLEQTREHERERLEPLDRPFEIERLLEALFRHGGHERARILAARQALPRHTVLAETRRHIVRGQGGEVAEGAEAPSAEGGGSEVRGFDGSGGRRCEGSWFVGSRFEDLEQLDRQAGNGGALVA